MNMQINLASVQPETNTANAKTSASSNAKTTTKNFNSSDKKSGKNFTDVLADANTKAELPTESATNDSSVNLMNTMAGLTNVAVLVAISSMQVTPVDVETTTKADDTVTALSSQGEEKNFAGMMQTAMQDNKLINQLFQQVDSGITTEFLKNSSGTASVNTNNILFTTKPMLASELSQTQLTADATKVNHAFQLKTVNQQVYSGITAKTLKDSSGTASVNINNILFTTKPMLASELSQTQLTADATKVNDEFQLKTVNQQLDSGITAETLKVSDLSQTQLLSDTAKATDAFQLKAVNDALVQIQVMKNSINKGEQVVNTVEETPVLQEVQVMSSNLENPVAKTTGTNKLVEKSKDNAVNVKVTNISSAENTILANANVAATNVTNDANSKINVDSTLTTTTLSVAEKPTKLQIPTGEIASNHAEQPTTNQFGQFVTLATNQFDKNMRSEANTTATTSQPLAEYDIPGQIVEQAHLIKGTEDTQMVIKLKPEHLGELTLKVTVENGTVSASFHSDNSQVRGLLETTMAQLKQDLTSQGIKVDTVGVYGGLGQFLSDSQSQSGQQSQSNRFKNRKMNVEDFADEVDKVGGLMSASGVTDDGVDYRV